MTSISIEQLSTEARLGGGAFADVFSATDGKQRVALKVACDKQRPGDNVTGGFARAVGIQMDTGSISPVSLDPNAVLAAEAHALASVKHPSFVRLLGQGEKEAEGGVRRYLVLELVEGRSWRELLIARTPIPLGQLCELAESLAAAAEAGGMPYHGDVKPENVLTDRSQRVRLIDPASAFGREKGSNQRVLTPLYNPWFDKSDVAAFGLTLVEALTGKQLLACASRNRPLNKLGPRLTQSVAAAEGMGRSRYLAYLQWMPMPTELQPDFPEPLEQLALRCLRLERTGGGLELADPPRRLGVIARELRRIGG